VQNYNQGLKSYRDQPLRIAEFGLEHRTEPSGTLHGLMRARRFVQDDAHVFCTENQIEAEVDTIIDIIFEVYRDFGFESIDLAFSTRPEQRVGDDALWDKSEAALEACLKHKGLAYRLQPGEGAFYGPKIEFTLHDSIGRAWQCGTVQLDFSMPQRLGAHYIAEDNSKQVPVMIHRAILGSLERFIGILIEHHAGNLPPWLAPRQAVIMNITDHQADYARSLANSLRQHGVRLDLDLRNEKIGYKIREHILAKVPFLLVVGDREMAENRLAVRTRDGKDLGSMSAEHFVEHLNAMRRQGA
jgi:threonyl-tRNA synthetase